MQDHESLFRRWLESKGLKLTKNRQSVLAAAFALHEHFDAEQLYGTMKGKGVSLATVYRTLPLLVEAGLIQHAVRNAGRDCYEHIYGHPKHIHWICSECQSVIETDIATILPYLKQQSEAIRFEIAEVNISISGKCWKCSSI